MRASKSKPSASASPEKSRNNGHPSANDNSTSVTVEAAPKPPPQPLPPLEFIEHPRSLRMQYRFWRTLLFAWWTFGRLLAWYFVMPRLIGRARVERGNLARWARYARQFRHFAVTMGGVMIKLGQFISTRVDVLPEAIIRELESLQDEVPEVPYDPIHAVIEQELGPLDSHFQWLDERPVAAASLGQVHRARLLTGERVVVKVQRPGIRTICHTDMAALKVVARAAMKFRFIRRRADTVELAHEFSRVLLEELSYQHEAHNAARFADMFSGDMGVYIPTVYTELTTDRVITLEDVTSIKINDFAGLEAAGISRKAVAARLMDTYLRQIFEERFFHADPHPGNLFVYPLPADHRDGQRAADGRPFYLIFVDFGMTGALTERISRGLVNTLAAVVARDPRRMVESYRELGVLLPEVDLDRLEAATRATFDQMWGLTMSQIQNLDYRQITRLGREFNDLVYTMPFRMPQDFIYLGRCVGILSGMCTSLDPAYNPWHELQPYARRLVAGGFGLASAGEGLRASPTTIDAAWGFPLLLDLFNGNGSRGLLRTGQQMVVRALTQPMRVEALLDRLERGASAAQPGLDPQLEHRLARIEAQGRRTTRAAIFGSLLVSATLLLVSGYSGLAVVGYALAGVALVWVVVVGTD